jgi:tetratricopeptide (TPR) repeat protein
VKRRQVLLAALALLAAGPAHGDESDPLPVPPGGPRARAILAYNDGVKLMLEKRYPEAQRRFEEALALEERIAEAHNNLAFSLRMQSLQHAERALRHYARALELDPRLAQAYLYRGTLYQQLGEPARAREDLAALRRLDAGLAARLERTLGEAGARDERDGLAAQKDDPY